jgi:THO complex subunit 4
MTIRGLPYDISRTEIQELCERFGNPLNVHLVYDRTDRSTGIAHITYSTYDEAKDAVHEIDGAKAHGQPVSAIIRPPPAKRSLFERIEYPAGRRNSADKGRANNRRNNNNSSDDAEESGYQSSSRHTYNTSSRTSGDKGTGRPALDRYVPPQRAGRDRTPRNRDAAPLRPRNGGNRVDRKTESGGRGGRRNERPRKTQEQMDMELDDYFSKGAAAAESGADSKAAEVPAVPLTIQHDDMELEL